MVMRLNDDNVLPKLLIFEKLQKQNETLTSSTFFPLFIFSKFENSSFLIPYFHSNPPYTENRKRRASFETNPFIDNYTINIKNYLLRNQNLPQQQGHHNKRK